MFLNLRAKKVCMWTSMRHRFRFRSIQSESAAFCFDFWFLCFCLLKGRFSRGIKNYEIIYPVKVSASGQVISHNLKHFFPSITSSRHQRHAYNTTVRYKIAIDRDEKHVTLQPNSDLVAPGSVVEYRRARSSEGLPNVELKPLSENHCHFHGHVDGEEGSRAALSTCDGLVKRTVKRLSYS